MTNKLPTGYKFYNDQPAVARMRAGVEADRRRDKMIGTALGWLIVLIIAVGIMSGIAALVAVVFGVSFGYAFAATILTWLALAMVGAAFR